MIRASSRFEMALPSALQEKFYFNMAVVDLLGGGSVTVRQMTALAVAHMDGLGQVSVMVAATLASSSTASLLGMSL